MPERPRFAPVDALFPPVEPSVSQYSVAARAGPPNSDTAIMPGVTIAAMPGMVTNRLLCIRKYFLLELTESIAKSLVLVRINLTGVRFSIGWLLWRILPSQNLTDKFGPRRSRGVIWQ